MRWSQEGGRKGEPSSSCPRAAGQSDRRGSRSEATRFSAKTESEAERRRAYAVLLPVGVDGGLVGCLDGGLVKIVGDVLHDGDALVDAVGDDVRVSVPLLGEA